MTDHPMECYPGQFEPWKPHSHVLNRTYIAPEEFIKDYDGLERYGVSHSQIIVHSQTAINRMMSGQITSSTGGKPQTRVIIRDNIVDSWLRSAYRRG